MSVIDAQVSIVSNKSFSLLILIYDFISGNTKTRPKKGQDAKELTYWEHHHESWSILFFQEFQRRSQLHARFPQDSGFMMSICLKTKSFRENNRPVRRRTSHSKNFSQGLLWILHDSKKCHTHGFLFWGGLTYNRLAWHQCVKIYIYT